MNVRRSLIAACAAAAALAGLTVPGMPVGSPGMDQGPRVDPYDVLLVHADGRSSVYAAYGRR